VVVTGINPHRLRLASTFESAFPIEFDGAAIRHQHVLMKPQIPAHESAHNLRANPALLIVWKDEQMRIVNDQIPI
jgi:hypothetical protein